MTRLETLTRHEFGPEGAAYVRSYLGRNAAFGKRLGSLLELRDIEAGTVWALVPTDSPQERRVKFAASLFPPAGPPERTDAGVFLRTFDAASSPEIREMLADLLATPRASRRLFCVEDAYMRQRDFSADQDQWVRNVFFCGDEVYEYASAEAPLSDYIIREVCGADWRPSVGIVTSLPSGVEKITLGDSLDADALREMAATAAAVVVGAWDQDAPLIWQPLTL